MFITAVPITKRHSTTPTGPNNKSSANSKTPTIPLLRWMWSSTATMDSTTSRMLEERIRSVRQALERDADAAVLRARYAPSVTTSHGEQFLVPRVLLMYVCEIIVLR